MKLTRSLFEAYLQCKYKAWRMANGENGAIHEYAGLIDQLQSAHVSIATPALLKKNKDRRCRYVADIHATRNQTRLPFITGYYHRLSGFFFSLRRLEAY